VKPVMEEVALRLDGGQTHIEKLGCRKRELTVQRSRRDDECAARLFNQRPSDRREAFAHARFPSNDCAILQGRSGEILDLKGFQGRHGE
jgi:hypothetical protein